MSNKAKIYLYKEGDQYTDITGGWIGRQYLQSYQGGFYTIEEKYLEYGDNKSGNLFDNTLGYGGFITANSIDISNFNKLCVHHQIVSGYTANNANVSMVVCINAAPNSLVDTGGVTNLHSVDVVAGTLKDETYSIDISNRTGSVYPGVMGMAGAYSTDTIVCRLHYLYLESAENVISIINEDEKSITFTVNDINGMIDIIKIDIMSGDEILQTYTDNFNEITYNLESNDEITIVATYTQDNKTFETADLKILKNNNIIDENTVLYLRGDSFNDLSFIPKTVTNQGVVIESGGKFGDRFYFNQKYLDVPITFGTNDFTLEFLFNAKVWQASSGASRLFSTGDYSATNAFTCEMNPTTINFFIGSNGSTNKHMIQTSELSLNHDHHMAFVRNGSDYYVFIDGVKKISATIANLNFTNTLIRLGGNTTGNANELYHGYMENIRISDIARYTEEFIPINEPYTSISIKNFELVDNVVSCNITKTSQNETINKAEVLLNNEVVETYTNNYNNINYTINKYGDIDVEIRAYYYGDYYISEQTFYSKDLVLEEFAPLYELPMTASLTEVIQNFQRIELANNIMFNNLVTILNAKGIATNNTSKLSDLIILAKELVYENNSNAIDYTNLLYEKLISKGATGITETSSFQDLINAIENYELDLRYYLYNKGKEYIDRTGGWILRDTWTAGGVHTGIKNDDSLEINMTYDCAGYIADNVDFTDYTTLKVDYEITKNTDMSALYVIIKDDYPYNATKLAFSYAQTVGVGTIIVDISNVSGIHKLSCESYTGNTDSGQLSFKIYKIWME